MSTGIEVFCSVSSVHFIVCHFPIEHFSFAELTVLLRCPPVDYSTKIYLITLLSVARRKTVL
jgi:hypothetical protein